jgi:CheY-like chemotaxis protein
VSPRVLVVDDEPPIRELCRVSLELRGFEVVEAVDGEDALAQLRAGRPDVVLLDVMMPKLDGWGTLAAIAEDAELRNVPIVLMTALSDDADRKRAERAGVASFVAKPFDPQELVDAIRACTRAT